MLSEYAATMPRAEIIALALSPFAAGWAINRLGEHWARRPRVYDWEKDPQACADLYTEEALAALWRAVVARPDRVSALLGDERRAAAVLYPRGGNVVPLPTSSAPAVNRGA
jgi:hypothetical protein